MAERDTAAWQNHGASVRERPDGRYRSDLSHNAGICLTVYEEERRAVERLHVPRFFIPGGSLDLSANLGSIVARNVIEGPFTECVRARLEGLSLNDLQPGLMPALLWPLLRNAGSAALTPTARVC